jgi:hypothetical protein
MLLTACASVQHVAKCPTLSPPPGKAIDALEAAGRKDRDTANWTVDLSKHYDKLDQCNAKRGLFQ